MPPTARRSRFAALSVLVMAVAAGGEGHDAYLAKLADCHAVIVAAMRTKQKADEGAVANLQAGPGGRQGRSQGHPGPDQHRGIGSPFQAAPIPGTISIGRPLAPSVGCRPGSASEAARPAASRRAPGAF